MTTRIDIGPNAKGFELNFSFYEGGHYKHTADGSLTFRTYYGFYFYLITGKIEPAFLTGLPSDVTELSKIHKWVMVDDLDEVLEDTLRANTDSLFNELPFETEDIIVEWDKETPLNLRERRWLKIARRVVSNPL